MPTYCTAQDVANFRQRSSNYDGSSTPTLATVEDWIEDNEAEIDSITKTTFKSRQTDRLQLNAHEQRNRWWGRCQAIVELGKKRVFDLDSDLDDVLEVWNGSQYEDYLSTKTQGRANDFWIDNDNGRLYFSPGSSILYTVPVIIKFRYGYEEVPRDIKRACVLMTAGDTIQNSDCTVETVEGGVGMSNETKATQWREKAMSILQRYVHYEGVRY